MDIKERFSLLKKMVKENRDRLAIMVPVTTLEIILEAYANHRETLNKLEGYKKKYHQERSMARYYKKKYEAFKRKELDLAIKNRTNQSEGG